MQGNMSAAGDKTKVTHKAASAQLLTAYLSMKPEWQKALLDIAEVYAERYPRPSGVYIV